MIHDPDAEAPRVRPGSIRFHRIDATEADDAISAFGAQRQLVPNASVVGSWESAQVLTRDGEASADAAGLPLLEVFTQPRAGRFAAAGHADLEARSRLDALRLPHTLHRGAGSARQLAAGAAFTLTQHPGFAGEAFVPLTVEHRAVNNLGSGIAALLGQPADAAAALDRGSYRNRFLAVPAATPIVPLPRTKPHLHGPQTATVVGLPDSAVTANRDHQVRVQFAWQRGPSPNAGGLVDSASQHPGHAPGDDSSGTWVPVAEWLAGPNWGSHFLPRIGAEVLVECLHGDLDAPRITGQLYNGDVAPPFTAGIDSPSNHPGTLSGLHTRSLDGSHTQQWGLDDAPGQLRQWLHTSLGTSRMELGYLVGPGNTRSGLQGQGYAVSTKAWGNVHAGQGLLLSTTARRSATSTQLDVREAVGQLKGAERTAENLHDTLQQQSVPGLSANPALVALREAIDPEADGKHSGSVNGQSAMQPEPGSRDPGADAVGRFAEPVLIAESPDRIALTTPKSAIASAGGALHMTVQDDAHLTAGQTFAGVAGQHLAVYAHVGPLRTIAANGPVSLQAHTGALELLADQSVTVTATDDRIDVLASKKIVLQAGQTQVTLEGGDITFACPGTFTVKASEHPFLGGEISAIRTEFLPQGGVAVFDDHFNVVDETTGDKLPDIPYRLKRPSTSEVLDARSSAEGKTDTVGTEASSDDLTILYTGDEEIRHGW